MRTIFKYIYDCFFSKPSNYQMRRHPKNKEMYIILFEGRRVHEGSYKSCLEYMKGDRMALSPKL